MLRCRRDLVFRNPLLLILPLAPVGCASVAERAPQSAAASGSPAIADYRMRPRTAGLNHAARLLLRFHMETPIMAREFREMHSQTSGTLREKPEKLSKSSG